MKISSKSILSPGRAGVRDPLHSLTTSLSTRRLRNSGSIKGGASPAMFPTARKRGSFDNPEPSSPKVTCIGQVRVRGKKKQGKNVRTLSRRHSAGDVSFRKLEEHEQGRSCKERLDLGSKGGCQDQESQRRWVHFPVTICDALRAFGSEFSCLFPCRKEEKTVGEGGDRRGSCGAVFARWLVAVEDGGGEREIELVVGDEEEEEEESVGKVRRHVFEDLEIVNDRIEGHKDEARVSICIPPKNALLLMRCRSDPVKIEALSNRSWEPNVVKTDEDDEHVDIEDQVEEKLGKTQINLEREHKQVLDQEHVQEHEGKQEQENVQANQDQEFANLQQDEVVQDQEHDNVPKYEVGQAQEHDNVPKYEVGEEDQEHDNVPKYDMGQDQELHDNVPKYEVGEDQEHDNVLKYQVGQDQELHDNVQKYNMGQGQEHDNVQECDMGQDQELHDNVLKYEVGEDQEHENVQKYDMGQDQEHDNVHKYDMGQDQEHDNLQKYEAGQDQFQEHNQTEEESFNLGSLFEEIVDQDYEIEEHEAEESTMMTEYAEMFETHNNGVLERESENVLSKLSMEETWVCRTDFIHYRRKPPPAPVKSGGGDESSVSATAVMEVADGGLQEVTQQPARWSFSLPAAASMAMVLEQKLEPFVLTRCKSEPLKTAASKLLPESCVLENRKLERLSRVRFGVGAAELGF